MKKVIVIGGGAAGLMAAFSAARQRARVTVLEKMPAVGRKLLITGKGRCNITNIAAIDDFIKNVPGNGKFLYKVFNMFDNDELLNFLKKYGVETKVERGGRVFPVSDKAASVVEAFKKALAEYAVEIQTNSPVKRILVSEGQASGVETTDRNIYQADAVVLTTGGASYPGTGSTGDGYIMAAQLGHRIEPVFPSLVPLEVAEDWISELQGLSLKNIRASLLVEGKKVAEEFGELLFTHFGLSGPIILTLSRSAAKILAAGRATEILISINLKPALSNDMLDKRIQRDFAKFARKQLKNSLGELLPERLIRLIIDLAFIDPDKPVHQVTKKERIRLREQMTGLIFTITEPRPLAEAIITAGGVSVKEINPATMESKLVKNLYLAGEVIDIDGFTGGFNLQAAFSTGYAAGLNAAINAPDKP